MYCRKCGTYNYGNSLICKKCKDNLVNQYLNTDNTRSNEFNFEDENDITYNESNSIENDKQLDNNKSNKENASNKSKKAKKKTSKSTKHKKDKRRLFRKNDKNDKGKNKNIDNKEVTSNNNIKSSNTEEVIVRDSLVSKLVILFLIILVFLLTGVCSVLGLYIARDKITKMPDVVGLSENEAIKILEDDGINYQIIKERVQDTTNDQIVIEQDKEAGRYILKNRKVKITVGFLENSNSNNNVNITLDNLIGKTKEEAIEILENNNIAYDIKEIYSDEEDNIVVDQSPASGDVIEDDTVVTIYISKSSINNNDDNNNDDLSNSNSSDISNNEVIN